MGIFNGFGELGVYRGTGEWGVTTLKINPVTNDYYVTLFQTVADAVTYARNRAYQSGLAASGGTVQYVVNAPSGAHDRFRRRVLTPVYRVLRVFEPVLDATGHRPPGPPRKDEQWVLVLRNTGVSQKGQQEPDLIMQGKGIRWKKDNSLSVRVPDYEESLMLARESRGSEQIARSDRIVRGYKQKVRQGRKPKMTGGPMRVPTKPARLMDLMQGSRTAQERAERARVQAEAEMSSEQLRAEKVSLAFHVAELTNRVEHIQSNIMRAGGPRKASEKLLSELEMVEERLAEAIEELEALG